MEIETVAAALPDDLVAIVLGYLPARSLAVWRRVCKAWRDHIDQLQLLVRMRPLLPHSVRGLFFNSNHPMPKFLSRPASTSSPEDNGPGRFVDGKFGFVQLERPGGWFDVVDHCNGLVLILESGEVPVVMHVCNPATRWSARLPPHPRAACYNSVRYLCRRAFLVFDPFVSPEYKVLLQPEEPWKEQVEKDACRRMDWPPSAWAAWHEFSSSTGAWEEKVFVREGEAAGTYGDLLLDKWGNHVHLYRCYAAAYWKGALYIHCPGEFVSRLSLLDDKYKVIKSPLKLAHWKNKVPYFQGLGKSEKGLYFAALTTSDNLTKLQVWTLRESSNNQLEWVPKDQSNLKLNNYWWRVENNEFDEAKYWTPSDLLPEYLKLHWDDGSKTQDISVEQNVSWNSEDDNIVDVSDDNQDREQHIKFLGFHPYKEVIFLSSGDAVVAFDLNSPKVQYLAEVNYCILESFVYTPCLIGD